MRLTAINDNETLFELIGYKAETARPGGLPSWYNTAGALLSLSAGVIAALRGDIRSLPVFLGIAAGWYVLSSILMGWLAARGIRNIYLPLLEQGITLTALEIENGKVTLFKDSVKVDSWDLTDCGLEELPDHFIVWCPLCPVALDKKNTDGAALKDLFGI